MRKFYLYSLFLCFSFATLQAQVDNFPYVEDFEEDFVAGENIQFLPSWTGNVVASGTSRIFQAEGQGIDGGRALGVQAIGSFSAQIDLSLDFTEVNQPVIEFQAKTARNGSGDRPVRVLFSTSTDGGISFDEPTLIGGEQAFPNEATDYNTYFYQPNASGSSQVVVRIVVEVSTLGSGTAARFFMDDFEVRNGNLPISINQLSVNSANQLQIDFNQELAPQTAEDVSNYSLSPEVNIQNADLGAGGQSVFLTIDDLQDAEYELTIVNIENESGGQVLNEPLVVSFSYLNLAVASIEVVDLNTLIVNFNQELDATSSQNPENYELSSGEIPFSAQFMSGGNEDRIRLRFDEPLNLGGQDDLTLRAISNVSGNSVITSKTITFLVAPQLKIEELIVLDELRLELIFNFGVELISANTASNYLLNGGDITITQAVHFEEDSKRVFLTLGDSLTTGNYQLQINNLLEEVSFAQIPENYQFNFSYLALEAVSISARRSDVLRLQFNQAVDTATATSLDNYTFSSQTLTNSLFEIEVEAEDRVVFRFSSDLPEGDFSVAIRNVRNAAKNSTIIRKQLDFTLEGLLSFRSLVINELFINPSPNSDVLPSNQVLPTDSNHEFAEIYNTGDEPISLSGYTFFGREIPGNFVLQPGGYVILCPEAVEEDYAQFGAAIGMPSWRLLPNTQSTVDLRDPAGLLIDEVRYTSAWYQDSERSGGGWSLEKINPFLVCSGESNWAVSESTQGATPGRQNSIFSDAPDLRQPKVTGVSVVSNRLIRVFFDKAMDRASLLSPQITLSDGLQGEAVSASSSAIDISLSSDLVLGAEYTVRIARVFDCEGNEVVSETTRFGIGRRAAFNEIIVTEIMSNPEPVVGLPSSEYIELYNATGDLLNLEGILFSDNSSTTTLRTSFIRAGEYLLLVPNARVNDFNVSGRVVGVTSWPGFNIGGDRVELKHPDGELIFSVDYQQSWVRNLDKRNGGWSLEMIDLNYPCLGAENWLASEDDRGGTPAAPNSVAASKGTLLAPELDRIFASDSLTLRLEFSRKLDLGADALARIRIEPAIAVGSISQLVPQLNVLIVSLESPLERGVSYEVTVENVSDCAGILISSQANRRRVVLPQPAEPGDILLNEILFRNRTGGVKFVELYNNSDKFINLRGWHLANSESLNAPPANLRVISNTDLVIDPRQYIALTTDISILLIDFPQTDVERLHQMQLPSYPISEGTVVLLDAQQQEYERYTYSDRDHFQLLRDRGRGFSLERIGFEVDVEDPSSWQSAASELRGTPGRLNSQFRRPGESIGKFTMSPEVFSPDNSGDRDFTELIYELENPGQSVKVTIFDSQGRQVRELVSRRLLGTKGRIKWDGTDDDGQKLRVGNYMVVIELLDMSAGVAKIYKERVVIGGAF